MADDRSQLPQVSEAISRGSDEGVPSFVSRVWYQFFRFVEQAITNFGVQASVQDDVIAAGTVQGDATLVGPWSVVATTPANSGVIMDTGGTGTASRVWNRGANSLKVYPPVGCQIDALAINAPYALAVNKTQEFSQVGPTLWLSTQLG